MITSQLSLGIKHWMLQWMFSNQIGIRTHNETRVEKELTAMENDDDELRIAAEWRRHR